MPVGDERGHVLLAGYDLRDFTRYNDALEDFAHEAPLLHRCALREETSRILQVACYAHRVDHRGRFHAGTQCYLKRAHLLLVTSLIDLALRVQSLPSVDGEPIPLCSIRIHSLCRAICPVTASMSAASTSIPETYAPICASSS